MVFSKHNFSISLVYFVSFTFFITCLASCSSSLSHKSVSDESKCNCKKDSYWYNEVCWKNFSYSEVTTSSVDSIVNEEMKAFSTAAVELNGENFPLNTFLLLPEDKDYLSIVTFNKNEKEYALISVVNEKKLKKKGETFPATLLCGNVFDDDVEPVFVADGSCIIKLLDKENLTLSFQATLEDTDQDILILNTVTSESFMGMGNSRLEVKDDEAYISGELGTITYYQITQMLTNHPEVKTLVLGKINGSVNDEVNVLTGKLVHENGLSTKVLSDSEIASGGVDLFCAGVQRIVESGAKIGVHSWCCYDDLTAIEIPRNHPAHRHQIDYFSSVMGKEDGVDFYYYTLEAAAFDDIHWMSDQEIKNYKVCTKFVE